MNDPPVRIPIEAELDLHAFAPADIVSVVDEYVEAAVAAGLAKCDSSTAAGAACSAPPYKRHSNAIGSSSNSGTIRPLTLAPHSPDWHPRCHLPERSSVR